MNKKQDKIRRKGRKVVGKQDQLIGLLQRKTGAKNDVLVSKLGWLLNTVRAAISRLWQRRYVIEVKRLNGEGGPTYLMTGGPSFNAPVAASGAI
jgi:hypothetical protein